MRKKFLADKFESFWQIYALDDRQGRLDFFTNSLMLINKIMSSLVFCAKFFTRVQAVD